MPVEKYTKEQILDKVTENINKFGKNRNKMTDSEIGELRAKISVGIYNLANGPLTVIKMRATTKMLDADAKEAEVYKKEFGRLRSENYSKSQADDMARKHIKGDKELLQARREFEELKDEYYSTKLIVDSAKEVLNAMALRKTI